MRAMFAIGADNGVLLWDERKNAASGVGPEGGSREQVVAVKGGGRVAAIGPGRAVWQRSGTDNWQGAALPDSETRLESLMLAKDGETLYAGGSASGSWPARAANCRCPQNGIKRGARQQRRLPSRRSTSSGPVLYLNACLGGIVCTSNGGAAWAGVSDGLELNAYEVATPWRALPWGVAVVVAPWNVP